MLSPTLLLVNLQDVRKSLSELQSGLKRIRTELKEHFSDIEQVDRYGKQMWSFVGDATSKLDDLKDDVNYASNTFTEVATYYGEDEKNVTSSEFYGIFKTFVTSYKVNLLTTLYFERRTLNPLVTEMSRRQPSYRR